MPAKKTFGSVRVRGPATFDRSPLVKGVAVGVERRYVALLTQEGAAAPVASVLHNDFSPTPALARLGLGIYSLTLANAFPANKTVIVIGEMNAALPGWFSAAYRLDDSTIKIETQNMSGDYSDELLADTPILITVFN